MSPLKNLLLCRRFAQKMINERNLALAADFIADGSVHHEIEGMLPGCPVGPKAMAQFLDIYLRAFPDLRIVFEDALADGDRVMTRWRFEGTQNGPLKDLPASGRPVSVEGIRIDRIERGKIAESWMQMDTLALMEQLGARTPAARRPNRATVPSGSQGPAGRRTVNVADVANIAGDYRWLED